MAILTYRENIFQTVKQIPTIEVARRYLPGLELHQRGSRYMTRCPFHEDRDPSFVIFPDGWKCFGCQAGGDQVTLLAKAANLSPIEAARVIARDFGLPADKPLSIEEHRAVKESNLDRQIENAFRAWCKETYIGLCALNRAADRVLHRGPGHPAFVAAVTAEPYIEYLLDILQNGPDEVRLQLFLSGEADQWVS